MLKNKQKLLLLLIGIPGSGKSTFTKKLKSKHVVISPDLIRIRFLGEWFNPDMEPIIWDHVHELAATCLYNNKDVVIDATNVNTFYRKLLVFTVFSYLPLETIKKIKLQAKIFHCPPEKALKRIRKRKHNTEIPSEVVYKMHEEFKETLKNIKKEGFEII